MTKHLALFIAAAITAGACTSESARSLTGPTPVTSAAATTGGTSELKRYQLTGTVDSIVKPLTALRLARVQVRSGMDEGRFALTDANGNFALNDLAAGAILVTVSLDGFQTWESTVNLFENTRIDPKLMPLP